MTSRNSGAFSTASLALIGTLWFSPVFAQDENPTTPGAIPNPSTYQGSTELQRQSDQQDQQYRQQQQQQQQSSYPGQPRQGGYSSAPISGSPTPAKSCIRNVAGIRALAPIAGKIELGGVDPARVDLFDDHSKPTAAEKILLAKWDDAFRYCHSLMQEDPRFQTPAARFMDSHWGYPATHALLTQLLTDQLTYGQFNYQRAMNVRAWDRYSAQIYNH